MAVLGITGGVATGKSTFSKLITSLLGAEVFDADTEARSLTATDPEVLRELEDAFGKNVFTEEGTLDRNRMREMIFASGSARNRLESILHPRIRNKWVGLARDHRADPARPPLFVDIPLLYETGGETECDGVVVVGCSGETQIRRLTETRGLEKAMAESIRDAQMKLSEKITRCDWLAWNDGSLAALECQARLLADTLLRDGLQPQRPTSRY